MGIITERDPAAVTIGVQTGERWKLRFFTIWIGQALSLTGSALTQFLLLWWIADTTGSAAALATAGMMALLPQALLAPLGGVIADRFSRRTIMIGADGVSALSMVLLIALMVSGNVQLWHVYVLMFVRSSMQAFQQPAAAASTAMLVSPDWLPRAAGMNQALVGVMTIASAPLGALALAFLPLHSALLIDVVTALLGIAPLFVFTIPQLRPESSISNSMWADLKAGGTYVVRRRGLLMLYLVVGLVVLTIMPTFSLTPLLVKEWFRGGVNQVAFMEALAGIGIILGGVLIGLWPGPRRRIVTVLVSFAVSCGTVALTALAPRDMLLLATFWWFVSGVTFATGNAPMMAILQSTVPNTMQGRVLSLLNAVTGLAGPIGLAIAGPLGEALGVRAVFIIGGALSALICLLGLLSPALMRIEETAM